MKIAFGLKAHSGWAALVAVGHADDAFVIVDRRRIELVEDAWARQPYHAAETLKGAEACGMVTRGIEAARRIAVQEMRAAIGRERARGNDVTACGVLVGNPMPEWSIEEILAVHFRMHKAEGVLFRDALVRATEACGLPEVAIPEAQVAAQAEHLLAMPAGRLAKAIGILGKSVGPPWGKDQKDAALAALIALHAVRHPKASR